ncbi:MAG: hypothetical protein AAFY17_12295 [Cyanobacteria bacterium J06642_11]
MTAHNRKTKLLPMYVRFWNQIKQFPGGLATGADASPPVSGPAAAALVSAAFSCFTLMVNQHLCSMFDRWNEIVWSMGDWIPGSKNPDPIHGEIGSYSGKETVMLISWLVSWLVLSQLWKRKNIRLSTIFTCLFMFITAATVMNWHPLFPYLPLMPK